jgi:hypothetical protein
MAKEDNIKIERTERDKYRWYCVLGAKSGQREKIEFTPWELVQIAGYVLLHQEQLEREAKEDEERNARAWSEDMKDMEQIRREWRAYRDEGTGA